MRMVTVLVLVLVLGDEGKGMPIVSSFFSLTQTTGIEQIAVQCPDLIETCPLPRQF
jgi:hypothetical protein